MALTEKQQQAYDRLRKGEDPKDIAKAMGVTKAMVYTHIRAIKGQGLELPAKYANVGSQAAAKKAGRNGSRAAAPAPTPEPEPTPEPTPPAAEEILSVDGVFTGIDAHLEREQARIVARLVELGDEHTRLNDALKANRAEAEDLSAAGSRVAALRDNVKNPPKVEPSEDGSDGAKAPATV